MFKSLITIHNTKTYLLHISYHNTYGKFSTLLSPTPKDIIIEFDKHIASCFKLNTLIFAWNKIKLNKTLNRTVFTVTRVIPQQLHTQTREYFAQCKNVSSVTGSWYSHVYTVKESSLLVHTIPSLFEPNQIHYPTYVCMHIHIIHTYSPWESHVGESSYCCCSCLLYTLTLSYKLSHVDLKKANPEPFVRAHCDVFGLSW